MITATGVWQMSIKEDDDASISLGANKTKEKRNGFSFSKKGRDILPDILVRGLNRDNFFMRRAEGGKAGYESYLSLPRMKRMIPLLKSG